MPKQKIRWGILATGRVAQQFARGLSVLPDAELMAVGSRNLSSAKLFADAYGIPKVHGSYEALAADPEVDIIYVATPHIRHARDCRLVLEAGKPVLCEKPFAVSAIEAGSVIALARSKGLFCMEAMWMRFMPLIAEVKALISDGAIGRPELLTADFGYAAAYDPKDRLFDRSLAGGCLLDRGIYPLSLAYQLFGNPSSVSGQATMTAGGVDRSVGIVLKYADGPLAVLTSTLIAMTSNEAVITGATGEIRIHAPFYHPTRLTITVRKPATPTPTELPAALSTKQKLLLAVKESALGQRLLASRGRGGKSRTIFRPDNGNGYHHEAAEAMRCLREGITESDRMPLGDTLGVLKLMDTLRRDWNLSYPGEVHE
ncbi:Gfo/Idh/MocA family oxidoreductase [Isosphaeraceae bacterium EP7]